MNRMRTKLTLLSTTFGCLLCSPGFAQLTIDVTGQTGSQNISVTGSGSANTTAAGGFPNGFGVDETGNAGILGDIFQNGNQNFEGGAIALSSPLQFTVNGAPTNDITFVSENTDPNGDIIFFGGPLNYGNGDTITFIGGGSGTLAGSTTETFDQLFNLGTYMITQDGVTFTVNVFLVAAGGDEPPVIVIEREDPAPIAAPTPVVSELDLDPITIIDFEAQLSAQTTGQASISATMAGSVNSFRGLVHGVRNRIRSGITMSALSGPDLRISGVDDRWTSSGMPFAAAGVAAPISIDTYLPNWELYTMGAFNLQDQSQIGAQPGYGAESYSGTIGIERYLNQQLLIGFATTLGRNAIEAGANAGGTDVDGLVLDAYAIYTKDRFWTSLRYGVGLLELDINRHASAGSTARANSDSLNHVVTLAGGLNLPVQLFGMDFVHGPNLGLEYITGQVDGYTESGADAFNLIVDEHNYASLVSEVGWSLAKQHDLGKLGRGFLQLRASWNHEHLMNESETGFAFETSPISIFDPATGLTTEGPEVRGSAHNPTPQNDYMVVGLHLTQLLGAEERWTFRTGYQTQLLRSDFSEHYGYARLSVDF